MMLSTCFLLGDAAKPIAVLKKYCQVCRSKAATTKNHRLEASRGTWEGDGYSCLSWQPPASAGVLLGMIENVYCMSVLCVLCVLPSVSVTWVFFFRLPCRADPGLCACGTGPRETHWWAVSGWQGNKDARRRICLSCKLPSVSFAYTYSVHIARIARPFSLLGLHARILITPKENT